MTKVQMSVERDYSIKNWIAVWHSTDDSILIQNENTKIDDKNISAETKNNRFEIDTEDAQLNAFCSAERSNTHFHLNSHATIEYLNRSCSSSISSLEIRERRSVKRDDDDRRLSAKVDFVDAIIISSSALERSQNQDDSAQVEKQKWVIKEIVDKRQTRWETKYKVCWESSWLLRSELENARRLLREFEAKSWSQHEHKRGRSTRTDNDQWLCIHLFTIA